MIQQLIPNPSDGLVRAMFGTGKVIVKAPINRNMGIVMEKARTMSHAEKRKSGPLPIADLTLNNDRGSEYGLAPSSIHNNIFYRMRKQNYEHVVN